MANKPDMIEYVVHIQIGNVFELSVHKVLQK